MLDAIFESDHKLNRGTLVPASVTAIDWLIDWLIFTGNCADWNGENSVWRLITAQQRCEREQINQIKNICLSLTNRILSLSFFLSHQVQPWQLTGLSYYVYNYSIVTANVVVCHTSNYKNICISPLNWQNLAILPELQHSFKTNTHKNPDHQMLPRT